MMDKKQKKKWGTWNLREQGLGGKKCRKDVCPKFARGCQILQHASTKEVEPEILVCSTSSRGPAVGPRAMNTGTNGNVMRPVGEWKRKGFRAKFGSTLLSKFAPN